MMNAPNAHHDQPTLDRTSAASPLPMRELLVVTLVLIAIMAVTGGLAQAWWPRSGAAREVVDLQTPATLATRLRTLTTFDGRRIAVLGDSLIYGRSLEEHGDTAWRKHHLTAILQARLDADPGTPHLVMNLGTNGATPADLEQMVRLVTPAAPDLVIIDVNLRSFSRDFAAPDAALTRPWLAEQVATPGGGLLERPSGAPLGDVIEQRLAHTARRAWPLYRIRDAIQARWMDVTPSAWLARQHGAVDARLRGDDSDDDEFILLMKARQRYAGVDLADDNPQRQALETALSELRRSAIPTLVFYARENPSLRSQILEDERYEQLRRQLAEIVAAANPEAVFVPDADTIEARHYLDHVHVDAEGYRRLLEHLWPSIDRLLPE